MIELQNVVRTYGSKVAVDRLDLRIPAGELFALLGPNGAGKTTTIKMIVGLLRPSSGLVSVCGHNVARFPREASHSLGYVPDEPYLYDKLTGREFLQFIADMYGLPPQVGLEAIRREICNFELQNFVDDLSENYSHGMKQRLVFAAAMVHDPPVLVVDEPMVGLDPRSMRLVKDLLRSRAESGATVLMSTHTLSVAEEIAHRIAIVNHGRLRFLGTLEQLRAETKGQHSSLEDLYLQLTTPGPTPPAPAESASDIDPMEASDG